MIFQTGETLVLAEANDRGKLLKRKAQSVPAVSIR